MTMLPLISNRSLGDILAWGPDTAIDVARYCADAQAIAHRMPRCRHIINLCEDRYHYAVLLAACALSGRISLQPASQSEATLDQILRDYGDTIAVTDVLHAPSSPIPTWPVPRLSDLPDDPVSRIPCIESTNTVAILFTSGSTGRPQPHRKTWGKMVANGRAEAVALGMLDAPHVLVGTVPAQHSYGFESTVLLALHGGCSFWRGKPFYPQDLAEALDAVPSPAMVVTSPYHLAQVMEAAVTLPPIARWLSATAALDPALAAHVEATTGAPVYEIYGSTESSQLATRRTTQGPSWTLMPDIRLEQTDDATWASNGHVEGRIALADIIALHADGRFTLEGRHADMVNLAGKRTSLAYLNHQLQTLDGVHDAAFFAPRADGPHAVKRLVAFVVAPGCTRAVLLAALRARIDPVFMPRPLVHVNAITHNSTGKVARSTLEALYARHVQGG